MSTRIGSKKHQQGMALRAALHATRREINAALNDATRKVNAALADLDAEIARSFGILSEHDLTDEHGVTWAERRRYDEELTDD